MRIVLRSKWFWILAFCIVGGVAFFLIYHSDSRLWAQATKLYNSLYNPHRLKRLILSYGAYSPLAYILLQVLQVIVAPIPGGAIEFLGGYLFGVNAGFVYSMVGLI